MATRSCSVRAHTRSLPDRLDTAMHRQLAAEIAAMKKTTDGEFDRFLAGLLARVTPPTGKDA